MMKAMKFEQIRKLLDVLVEESHQTVTGIKPIITVELGEESLMQLNQDINKNYPEAISYTERIKGSISKIDIQGHIIHIKKQNNEQSST